MELMNKLTAKCNHCQRSNKLYNRNHFPQSDGVINEDVSKNFRIDCLEWELQTVQLFTTRCSYIAIFWVSLVSFAAITLCVTSQRVFIVVGYFVIDSVRKLLDTPGYISVFGNTVEQVTFIQTVCDVAIAHNKLCIQFVLVSSRLTKQNNYQNLLWCCLLFTYSINYMIYS
jgi:hypothetical protein